MSVPLMVLSRILSDADRLCGGQNDSKSIQAYSEALFSSFGQYNIAVIAKAIRDGVNSGKVFGKLTYPLIAEWINAEINALENYAQDEHARRKA